MSLTRCPIELEFKDVLIIEQRPRNQGYDERRPLASKKRPSIPTANLDLPPQRRAELRRKARRLRLPAPRALLLPTLHEVLQILRLAAHGLLVGEVRVELGGHPAPDVALAVEPREVRDGRGHLAALEVVPDDALRDDGDAGEEVGDVGAVLAFEAHGLEVGLGLPARAVVDGLSLGDDEDLVELSGVIGGLSVKQKDLTLIGNELVRNVLVDLVTGLVERH